MIRKFLMAFAFALVFFSSPSVGSAQAEAPTEKNITIFVRDGCQKCEGEEKFFSSLSLSDGTSLKIRYINISENPDNKALFDKFVETFGLGKITPITLIGKQVFQGFDSPETTGVLFKAALEKSPILPSGDIESALENPKEIVIAGSFSGCDENATECKVPENSLLSNVNIPFLGTYDIRGVSLFSMAFILGLLDGFNPCAMWVLIIFLITLMQIGDRVKMAFVAGTFLVSEAVMYALIMLSWWKFFDFAGNTPIITNIVGVVAIAAGGFFLWEGFFTDGTCKITSSGQKKKLKDRISSIASSPISILSFFGILGLAFSVNIIEFACSAGYPQVFTNILSLSSFSWAEKVLSLVVYIFSYMLDDVIVFGIALYSIEKIGITHKFSRASNLIGGSIILILGILMIFSPGLLSI